MSLTKEQIQVFSEKGFIVFVVGQVTFVQPPIIMLMYYFTSFLFRDVNDWVWLIVRVVAVICSPEGVKFLIVHCEEGGHVLVSADACDSTCAVVGVGSR